MDQFADDDYYLLRMKDILDSYPQFSPPQHPTKLSDHIFIGNQDNADDFDLMSALEITHVLNCAGTRTFDLTRSPYPVKSGVVGFLMIPAQDYDEFDIMQYFGEAISFLEKARDAGGLAFIHCSIGVNRSGAVAAAYLMVSQKKPLLEVVVELKAKRLLILCNKGFRRQLVRFARGKNLLDRVEHAASRSPQLNPEAAPPDAAPASSTAARAGGNDITDGQHSTSDHQNGSGSTHGNFENSNKDGNLPKEETFDSESDNRHKFGNNQTTENGNGRYEGGNGRNEGGNGRNEGGNGRYEGGNGRNEGGNGRNEGGNGDGNIGPRSESEHSEEASNSSDIISNGTTPEASKLSVQADSHKFVQLQKDITEYEDGFEAKKAEIWKLIGHLKNTASSQPDSSLLDPLVASSRPYTRSLTNYQVNNGSLEPEFWRDSREEYLSALSLEHPRLDGFALRGSTHSSDVINDDILGSSSSIRLFESLAENPYELLNDRIGSSSIGLYKSSIENPYELIDKSSKNVSTGKYEPTYVNYGGISQNVKLPPSDSSRSIPSSARELHSGYSGTSSYGFHVTSVNRTTLPTYDSYPTRTSMHIAATVVDSSQTTATEYLSGFRSIPTKSHSAHQFSVESNNILGDEEYNNYSHNSRTRSYRPTAHIDDKPEASKLINSLSTGSSNLPEHRSSSLSKKTFVSDIKPLSFYRKQVNLKNQHKYDLEQDHEDDEDGGISFGAGIKPYKAGNYEACSSVRRYSVPTRLSRDASSYQPKTYSENKCYRQDSYTPSFSPSKSYSVTRSSGSENMAHRNRQNDSKTRPYSASSYKIQPSIYDGEYSDFADEYVSKMMRLNITPPTRNKSFHL